MFYSHVVKQCFIELVAELCSSVRNNNIWKAIPVITMYNCLAIVVAFLSGIGIYSIHFVKKH